MELSKQVCSLELSQQLKEAGYIQEGLWWWDIQDKCLLFKHPLQDKEMCVAPTVAELGERFDFTFHQYKAKRNKYVCLCGDAREEANTEADCRAKMYLYLKKQGVL